MVKFQTDFEHRHNWLPPEQCYSFALENQIFPIKNYKKMVDFPWQGRKI